MAFVSNGGSEKHTSVEVLAVSIGRLHCCGTRLVFGARLTVNDLLLVVKMVCQIFSCIALKNLYHRCLQIELFC